MFGRMLGILPVVASSVCLPAHAWGFLAHRIVTEKAVTAVPGSLGAFFTAHVGTISDRSLEPDTVLRGADPEEEPRHFVNLERYVPNPLDLSGLPRDFAAAVRRFGARRLHKNGVLPWWITQSALRLREAMRTGSADEVLRSAGYLAHYVADLHQPLHLTRNYDGRETGNTGVHAAYERSMIERYPRVYRAIIVRARTEPSPLDPTDWSLRRASEVFPKVALVLAADTAARAGKRGNEASYIRELDARLRTPTRALLSQAAEGIAMLWQDAWIEAGRPDPGGWTSAGRVHGPAGAAGE